MSNIGNKVWPAGSDLGQQNDEWGSCRQSDRRFGGNFVCMFNFIGCDVDHQRQYLINLGRNITLIRKKLDV